MLHSIRHQGKTSFLHRLLGGATKVCGERDAACDSTSTCEATGAADGLVEAWEGNPNCAAMGFDFGWKTDDPVGSLELLLILAPYFVFSFHPSVLGRLFRVVSTMTRSTVEDTLDKLLLPANGPNVRLIWLEATS